MAHPRDPGRAQRPIDCIGLHGRHCRSAAYDHAGTIPDIRRAARQLAALLLFDRFLFFKIVEPSAGFAGHGSNASLKDSNENTGRKSE